MNQLVTLCQPLLQTVSEYVCFAKAGAPVDIAELQDKLQTHFQDIRNQCEDDATLKRDFERIEKPLVFFIDYTIKEGHFPFSAEWREMARSYNELSGDEKFFDLLQEALDDPEASSRIKVFYTLMGLGFDGVHVNDKPFIERRMKICATRFPQMSKEEAASLFSRDAGNSQHRRKNSSGITLLVVATLLLMLAAFVFNLRQFSSMTKDYSNSLQEVLDCASTAPDGIETQEKPVAKTSVSE